MKFSFNIDVYLDFIFRNIHIRKLFNDNSNEFEKLLLFVSCLVKQT